MKKITEKEIVKKLRFDNPWWESGDSSFLTLRHKRSFFDPFYALIITSIQRAVVLMGARRVGKTILMKQAIAELIDNEKVPAAHIMYLSLDTPTYNFLGSGLDSYVELFRDLFERDLTENGLYIFFDEIQYFHGWEVHLKSLVDSYPDITFVASGSAAAALKLKSRESGAGRFSDFELPPVNFMEFLCLRAGQSIHNLSQVLTDQSLEPTALNDAFLEYVNFGGFPEAIFNNAVQENLEQFIKSDIIDKVLLKDIPDLYGISNIQELNRLFTTLAYNTGRELNTKKLAQESNMHHATVEKYLQYLQAAFLIKILYRVDSNARHFKRQTTYKVYLTNPCIRQALFGPVDSSDSEFGHIVETAVFSHLLQASHTNSLYYARWDKKEVDFVRLDRRQRVVELIEAKWSDAIKPETFKTVTDYALKNKARGKSLVLTKTTRSSRQGIELLPVSYYCLLLGVLMANDLLESANRLHQEHLNDMEKALEYLRKQRSA